MKVVNGMAEAELMKIEELQKTLETLQAMYASGFGKDPRFTLLLQLYHHHARRLHIVNEVQTINPSLRLSREQEAVLRSQIQAFQHISRNIPIPESVLYRCAPSSNVYSFSPLWLSFPPNPDCFIDSKQSGNPKEIEKIQKRDQRIMERMRGRSMELSEINAIFPPDPEDDDEIVMKTDSLVEWRKLQLAERQRELRREMLSIHQKLRESPEQRFDSSYPLRHRRLSGPGNYTAQHIEAQSRKVHEHSRKTTFKKFLTALTHHHSNFVTYTKNITTLRRKLNQAVSMYFKNKEKAELAAQEKAQKERMRLLRENDVDAYMKLVKETKNERLLHLLRQTDDCLQKLGAKVQLQRAGTHDNEGNGDGEQSKPDGNWDGENTERELDEMVKTKSQYYVLAHAIQETITEQPPSLTGGKLMNFQLVGLQWLVSLFNNNLNGILADEMGLGKTVQTVSLITHLMDFKGVRGPHIIVVPLTTLTNWKNEFTKWAPSIKTISYVGNQHERQAMHHTIMEGKFNVLLTSFQFALQDKSKLRKVPWNYLIVDEGHRLKNHNSKLSMALSKEFNTKHRLILTGTPLQNDMGELWSLLNFLLPNIFQSSDSFEEWFNAPFQRVSSQTVQMDEEEVFLVINRLHQVLRPFLLRRLKTDVENDLPEKFEEVLKCEISGWQKYLYTQIQSKNMKVYDEDTGKMRVANLMNTLMQLRKVCNHPYLFYEQEDDVTDEIYRCSGKFELLDRILTKMKATGHRVLIFNQMKIVMDIMCRYMEWKGYAYLRLDGGTKSEDRGQLLADFNAKDSPYFVFVLSTRAGGLGLNLQTADTVIIFDSDWNPQMDLQAQARAHRLGQKKKVHIYRLVTATPVEQEIVDRATYKLAIDAKVIQAGMFNDNSREHDRQQMLRSIIKATEESIQKVKIPTPREINRKIARSDEEYELFEKIDADIEREFRESWIADGGDPKSVPPRLMSEDDLPDWILKTEADAEEDEAKEQFTPKGRGCRQKQNVRYNDNLTDREWTMLLDSGANAEDIEKKRHLKEQQMSKRKVKLEERKKQSSNTGRDEGDSENENEPSESRNEEEEEEEEEEERERAERESAKIRQEAEAKGAKSKSTKIIIKTKPTPTPAVAVKEDLPVATPQSKVKVKRAEPQTPVQNNEFSERLLDIIKNVLTWRHPRSHALLTKYFIELPDAEEYPEYYEEIEKPICISEIRVKIEGNKYKTVGDFKDDFHLLCDNAQTFNQTGSAIYEAAGLMKRKMDEVLDGDEKLAALQPQKSTTAKTNTPASKTKATKAAKPGPPLSPSPPPPKKQKSKQETPSSRKVSKTIAKESTKDRNGDEEENEEDIDDSAAGEEEEPRTTRNEKTPSKQASKKEGQSQSQAPAETPSETPTKPSEKRKRKRPVIFS